MNILLIEDQVLIRELLALACRQVLPDAELRWAADLAKGMSLCRELPPDLVFLDIVLPDGEGIDAVDQLRTFAPRCKIIGLSAHTDEFTMHRVWQARLDGFVDKNEQTLEVLRQVIKDTLAGKQFFSAVVRRVFDRLRADPLAFTKVLSPREIEFLRLIGTGAINEEIALKLGVSEVTVRNHRQNIMVKLNLRSTPQLMRYALEKGFTRVGQTGQVG